MFKKILAPIDVREPEVSREALAEAEKLANAFAGHLRLIYVASPILPVHPMAAIPQQLYDDIGSAEKRALDEAAAQLNLPAGHVTTTVRIGDVYPELLAEAAEWGADLIVVGAHRRSMATYLLGSTAAALTRHSRCSVMIVRSSLKAKLI